MVHGGDHTLLTQTEVDSLSAVAEIAMSQQNRFMVPHKIKRQLEIIIAYVTLGGADGTT